MMTFFIPWIQSFFSPLANISALMLYPGRVILLSSAFESIQTNTITLGNMWTQA